jgi:ketose-bisphosphate aldolase
MSLVNSKFLVEDAQKRKYAVPALNTNGGNQDIIKALCEAAEELKSPLILAVYAPNTAYYGIEYFGMTGRYFAEKASVPIALHLDHGKSMDPILHSIRHGLTSVMIDYSQKSLAENIEITSRVVDIAHPLDVSVEAEVGRLLKADEEVDEVTAADNLTKVEDVKEFTSKIPVDLLAVGIGNAHGFYKGEPKIRTDLLREIRKTTNVPLVLHGGTGIPDEVIKECIDIGMTKVNVGTLIRTNYVKYYGEAIESLDHGGHPWKIQQHVKDRIKEDAKKLIKLFGSNDKF